MRDRFINESILDILVPKTKEEINDIFKRYGFTDKNMIKSIKMRKPGTDYVKLRFKRCVKYTGIKVTPYHGDVPEGENEKEWIKISGKIWNLYNFLTKYYGFEYDSVSKNIERLKFFTEISEGVADVYGEKKFGLPNEPQEQENRALILSVKDYDIILKPTEGYPPKELFKLIKNPSSPNNVINNARGLIDKNGNLYFNSGHDVSHEFIINFLENLNIINYDRRWNAHLPDDFLTIQRYKDTNIIAVGESNLFAYPIDSQYYRNAQKYKSFTEEEKNNAINYFFIKAKEKNPSFKFVNQIIRFYKPVNESMSDILKPKSQEQIINDLKKKGINVNEKVVNILLKNGYKFSGIGVGVFNNRISKKTVCFLNNDFYELRIDNYTTEKEIEENIKFQKNNMFLNSVNESIHDILKPKSAKEICDIIELPYEIISVKIRNPKNDKYWYILTKWLKNKKIKIENIDNLYSKMTGLPSDILVFFQEYYQFDFDLAAYHLRNSIINKNK